MAEVLCLDCRYIVEASKLTRGGGGGWWCPFAPMCRAERDRSHFYATRTEAEAQEAARRGWRVAPDLGHGVEVVWVLPRGEAGRG